MTRKTFSALIGLAGVAESENSRARRLGMWFEAPMLVLAIWIIIEWYLSANEAYPDRWITFTNRFIFGFFLIETVLLTFLVHDKRRYLSTNWMNLLIIAMGLPVLWHDQPYAGALRSLRILLLLGILVEMSATTRAMLRRNHLGMTLFVAAVVVVMAGISIAAIDPAIQNPWDGIWWAWVTVTTVGYGDIVPESLQGRVFGGFLMILGLGLFSLMTASFSAFLISRDDEEIIEKEREVVSEEHRAIAKLERIENRLEKLESGLSQLIEQMPPGAQAERDDESPGEDRP